MKSRRNNKEPLRLFSLISLYVGILLLLSTTIYFLYNVEVDIQVKYKDKAVLTPTREVYAQDVVEVVSETEEPLEVKIDPLEELFDYTSGAPNVYVGSPKVSKYIYETFGGGDLGLTFIAIAWAENDTMEPTRDGKKNRNGTYDKGVLQINSSTFEDFRIRHTKAMDSCGAVFFKDVERYETNICVAKVIYGEQGLGAWSTYKHGRHLVHLKKINQDLVRIKSALAK